MTKQNPWPAAAVHMLTASGAVLGFFALVAAVHEQWEGAFAWLGAALLVDGIDGPLARRFEVARRLPRFDGESLDLIADYVNYVLVPAYLIYAGGFLSPGYAAVAAVTILLSSLFHFIDRASKTKDGYFVGFPAIWNVVALYAFVFSPPWLVVFGAITFLVVLTFIPVAWVHPVRVRAWRPVTALVTVVWAVAAIAALVRGFPGDGITKFIFAATAVYFLALGMSRTVFPSD